MFKWFILHGGKLSIDRITILPRANMAGTEKLSLLVIGKAAKPRCFKGVKSLPTPYRANKTAWMTGAMLILEHDKTFVKEKRKVAMVLDNCPAHPHVIPRLKRPLK